MGQVHVDVLVKPGKAEGVCPCCAMMGGGFERGCEALLSRGSSSPNAAMGEVKQDLPLIPHLVPPNPLTCLNLGLVALLRVKVRVPLAMCAAVIASRTQALLDHAVKDSGQVTALSFLTGGELKCSKVVPGGWTGAGGQ